MIAEFMAPLDADVFMPGLLSDERWGRDLRYHFDGDFPALEDIDLAIIGVEDSRGSDINKGCANGPDPIRKELYKLCRFDYDLHIADLGNIKPGATLQDTYVDETRTRANPI